MVGLGRNRGHFRARAHLPWEPPATATHPARRPSQYRPWRQEPSDATRLSSCCPLASSPPP
eukprot:9941572-Lingulodinium_polyedra.AAC.1